MIAKKREAEDEKTAKHFFQLVKTRYYDLLQQEGKPSDEVRKEMLVKQAKVAYYDNHVMTFAQLCKEIRKMVVLTQEKCEAFKVLVTKPQDERPFGAS